MSRSPHDFILRWRKYEDLLKRCNTELQRLELGRERYRELRADVEWEVEFLDVRGGYEDPAYFELDARVMVPELKSSWPLSSDRSVKLRAKLKDDRQARLLALKPGQRIRIAGAASFEGSVSLDVAYFVVDEARLT
jgi:hypothetical protein